MKNNLFISLQLGFIRGSERIEDAKWVFGKNKKGEALILCKTDNDFHLTMAICKEMLEECKALGLKKPMHIWCSVNAGPNGSTSYIPHIMSIEMMDLCGFGKIMDKVEINVLR